jgi:hypothetical protein
MADILYQVTFPTPIVSTRGDLTKEEALDILLGTVTEFVRNNVKEFDMDEAMNQSGPNQERKVSSNQ